MRGHKFICPQKILVTSGLQFYNFGSKWIIVLASKLESKGNFITSVPRYQRLNANRYKIQRNHELHARKHIAVQVIYDQAQLSHPHIPMAGRTDAHNTLSQTEQNIFR